MIRSSLGGTSFPFKTVAMHRQIRKRLVRKKNTASHIPQSAAIMQSVQQSYLLISLLFSDGKILEKRYGGKINQYELRIITGGKNTAAPEAIDSLNRQ